jgi:hypothetical protein
LLSANAYELIPESKFHGLGTAIAFFIKQLPSLERIR